MITTSLAQKRLLREHHRLGAWRAVAKHYRVNVRYVYDLAVHGVEPKNQAIRRALGLHRLKPPKLENYTEPWVTEAVNNLQTFLDQKENHENLH